MDKDKAIQVVIKAVELGQRAGAYSLSEALAISAALEVIKQNNDKKE
jgi:hypothetical protein